MSGEKKIARGAVRNLAKCVKTAAACALGQHVHTQDLHEQLQENNCTSNSAHPTIHSSLSHVCHYFFFCGTYQHYPLLACKLYLPQRLKRRLDILRFTQRSGKINKSKLYKHVLISFTALLKKSLSVSQMMLMDSDDVRSRAADDPIWGQVWGVSL